MNRIRHPLLAALLLAAPVAAQELRLAIDDADLVVVGQQLTRKHHDDNVDLHRVQVVTALRGGAANTSVTVIDWPKVALHNRPTPRQQRLYCLHDASRDAQRIGLPANEGPYYKMSGRPGSNPAVAGEIEQDATVRFVRAMDAVEQGRDAAETTAAMVAIALGDDDATRVEASLLLAERPLLAARVPPVQWSAFLARTSAEATDLDYKIALAELCATQRLPGLVDALVVGLDTTTAPQYARAVGRLCTAMLGEEASKPILDRLKTHAEPEARKALMTALGATQSKEALDALLQWKQLKADDEAVEAGLREHKSRAAKQASNAKSEPKQPEPKSPEAPKDGGK